MRIFGVPLHPLLVHFPIAMWFAVPVLDVAAIVAGPEPWWSMALGATAIGVVFGAAAIATGLIEYANPSLVGIDMRLAARHGVRTSLAWIVFSAKLVAALVMQSGDAVVIVAMVMDVIGCGVLAQGVYFGTRQVYEQLERD